MLYGPPFENAEFVNIHRSPSSHHDKVFYKGILAKIESFKGHIGKTKEHICKSAPGELFGITQQASWFQTANLMTEFSICTSQPLKILTFEPSHGKNQQNGMCAQQRLESVWASQTDQSLCCPHEENLGP